jgi:hypothetical protein
VLMVKQDANARKDCLAQHAMWSSVVRKAAADTDVASEGIAYVKSVTEGRCARKR